MISQIRGWLPCPTLLEERDEESALQALGGEAIGMAATVAFEQAMGVERAQVVVKRSEAMVLRGQGVGAQDGLMELGGGTAAHRSAAAEGDFQIGNLPWDSKARIKSILPARAAGVLSQGKLPSGSKFIKW
jgi:hypothetical protein